MNLNWSLIGRFVPIRQMLGKESLQLLLTSVSKLSFSLPSRITTWSTLASDGVVSFSPHAL